MKRSQVVPLLVLFAFVTAPALVPVVPVEARTDGHWARQMLEWIPPDSDLILGFDSSGVADKSLFARFQDELYFGLDLNEDVEAVLSTIDTGSSRDAERLILAAITTEGQERSLVALAKVGPPSDGMSQRDAVPVSSTEQREITRLRLSDDWIAVGDRAAIGQVAHSLEKNRSSPSPEKGLSAAIEDSQLEHEIWGIISGSSVGPELNPEKLTAADIAGRSLARSATRLRSAVITARVRGKVEFEVSFRTADAIDAGIIADGLYSFLAPFQSQGNSAPDDVKESIRSASVHHSTTSASLSMNFTAKALDSLRRNQASKRLLQLKLGPENREVRERVGKVVEALGISPGSRVADIGCGSGFFTTRLSRAVGSQGQVVCVDIDQESLDSVQRRLTGLGIANARLVLGAEDDPKLDEGALDAVLIVNAYHEMSAYPKMLDHIRRALKPGGRFVLMEPYALEARDKPRGKQTEKHRIAPELVEEELVEAGFEVIAREDDFVTDENSRNSLVVARRPARDSDTAP